MGEEKLEDQLGLRDLAVRHGVRCEVVSVTEVMDHQLVRVGFDVLLYGLHEHPEGVIPGCEECQDVYDALGMIARSALPGEPRPTSHDIGRFERALFAAPDLKDRWEVGLGVRLVHREDYFAPVDRCEERYLAEIKVRLGGIGVREGRRARRR